MLFFAIAADELVCAARAVVSPLRVRIVVCTPVNTVLEALRSTGAMSRIRCPRIKVKTQFLGTGTTLLVRFDVGALVILTVLPLREYEMFPLLFFLLPCVVLLLYMRARERRIKCTLVDVIVLRVQSPPARYASDPPTH